ncbi:MAG: hypothetical protein ABIH66_04475 [bacterium]
MNSLQSQFFKLSLPLRIAVGVIILAAIMFGAYTRIIVPEKTRYETLAKIHEQLKSTNEAKMTRIENLRSTSETYKITEQQIASLQQAGNAVSPGSELPAIIEEIKDAARRAGAKDVSITEGEPLKKLVQLDSSAGMFVVSVLPLELTFESNYRKISELLFTLRGKRLFFGIPGIEMESGANTSNVNTTISLELYYREES